MIRIQNITFYNYLPYYKEKVFDLSGKEGTTLIFGDNNMGKTSFINGIKFLFYNTLYKNPDNPDFNIYYNINRKAFAEKDYMFFVSLDFTHEGKEYHFIRRYRTKSDTIGSPKSDNDFEHDEIIKEGDKYFTERERKELINRIIPKNISEFVFFDGENVKKYIEILNDDSDSGAENRKVKEAINNVIGTPYLDSLINNLILIKKEYTDEFDHKLQQHSKDEKKKAEIEKLLIELKEKNSAKDTTKYLLAKTNDELNDVDKKLSNLTRSLSVYEEIGKNQANLDIENQNLENAEKKLKELLSTVAKNLLYDKLSDEKKRNTLIIEKLGTKINDEQKITEEIQQLKGLYKKQECSLCGSKISQDQEQKITQKIETLQKRKNEFSLSNEERNKYNLAKQKNERIDNLLKRGNVSPLQRNNIIQALLDIKMSNSKINEYKQKISRLKDELKDEKTIYDLITKRDMLTQKIKEYEETLQKLEQEINALSNKINNLRKRIKDVVGLDILEKKITFIERIINAFINIRENFIEEMRSKVEREANEIFLDFVNGLNNDIARVEINKNYRMSIFTRNGDKIPVPGTGYNTLLALSLIYGLNRNTHLFGAIFFDAALSNLSNNYTRNVIRTLSSYAPQLIFLAHKDRVDINDVIRVLGGQIVNQFEIYQNGDAFNTNIRRL